MERCPQGLGPATSHVQQVLRFCRNRRFPTSTCYKACPLRKELGKSDLPSLSPSKNPWGRTRSSIACDATRHPLGSEVPISMRWAVLIASTDALPHWGTYREHVLARYNATMLWTRRSSHWNYTEFPKDRECFGKYTPIEPRQSRCDAESDDLSVALMG